MKKDFQRWHTLKSSIHEASPTPLFRERELWWCSLGANIGVEADGKNDLFERPILVWRKFNKEMFWGLPITSKEKTGKSFYFTFGFQGETPTVVLSQLRVLSSKRLIRRLGKLSDSEFEKLNNAISDFIKETDPLRGPRVPNGNK